MSNTRENNSNNNNNRNCLELMNYYSFLYISIKVIQSRIEYRTSARVDGDFVGGDADHVDG